MESVLRAWAATFLPTRWASTTAARTSSSVM